jgi:DNA polymerase IV
VEPFGLDETWLDVTGSVIVRGDGEFIANEIWQRVKDQLGITASVSVADNKIFAKLGSDMKKPDATTIITRQNLKERNSFVIRLPPVYRGIILLTYLFLRYNILLK